MYIMTEDRKTIIDASGFAVDRTLGNKNGKFAIFAIAKAQTLASLVVASFPDEESAKLELQNIWAALEKGQAFYRKEKSV